MKIFVTGIEIAQSVHSRQEISLDTVIICYAHDSLSLHYPEAHLIIKASIQGLIGMYVSYQNPSEFYSIMTGRRVKKPLAPSEASDRRNVSGEGYRRRVSEWCKENA